MLPIVHGVSVEESILMLFFQYSVYLVVKRYGALVEGYISIA